MLDEKSSRIILVLLIFSWPALLAGCSRQPPSAPKNPPADSAAAGARSDSPAVASRHEPARRTVVSLVPSVTETLFAMGLGPRLVGRSRYCNYPSEAEKLPIAGDALNVDLERLLVLKPDLVIFHTRAQSADRLTSAGIRPLAPRIETVAEVYGVIELLGRELGAEPQAKALEDRLREELAAVRQSAKDLPPVRTLITFPEVIGGGAEVRVVGRHTFVDELLGLVGGANAVPTEGYPRVSIETVVTWQPEVIIISAPGDIAPGKTDAEYRAAWDRWQSIPAVKNGRVVVLREPFLTIPGPRMGQAAKLLFKTLHPEPVK
jgi:iron complex transport system substrate-binding protein